MTVRKYRIFSVLFFKASAHKNSTVVCIVETFCEHLLFKIRDEISPNHLELTVITFVQF